MALPFNMLKIGTYLQEGLGTEESRSFWDYAGQLRGFDGADDAYSFAETNGIKSFLEIPIVGREDDGQSSALDDLTSAFVDPIVGFFEDGYNWLTDALAGATETLSDFVNGFGERVGEILKSIPGMLIDLIKGFFESVWNTIVG